MNNPFAVAKTSAETQESSSASTYLSDKSESEIESENAVRCIPNDSSDGHELIFLKETGEIQTGSTINLDQLNLHQPSNQILPLYTTTNSMLSPLPRPVFPIANSSNNNSRTIEIVDTISNPVCIPEDDGLALGPFGNLPTLSEEQIQQLLNAAVNAIPNGPEVQLQVQHSHQQQQNQLIHQQQQVHLPLHQMVNSGGAGMPSGGTLTLGQLRDVPAGIPLDVANMYIKPERDYEEATNLVSHCVKDKGINGKCTKPWKCDLCQKVFGHQYILMRHLPTHTDERKFRCNVCGKAFRQMSTLSQHRAIHSADRPFVCHVCDKTFNRVSTLISHRKTHTGLKPHQCHLCCKAFHQKGNLRNHIFTHTNERPYKCDVCPKGFNQMSNLMCHKLKAHQRIDKPKYNCQSCNKVFQKRMGLRNHEQYEHGDNSGKVSTQQQRIKYTNGVIVDQINTAAMQLAFDTNQIPFALLKPLNNIPVLVRVLEAGEKQLLVPATAEDLKRHGHIIMCDNDKVPPPLSQLTYGGAKEAGTVVDIKTDADPGNHNQGLLYAQYFQYVTMTFENAQAYQHFTQLKCTGNKENKNSVQIRIPVVATVIQRCDRDGNMRMDVESPGPTSADYCGLEYGSQFVPSKDSPMNEVITQLEVFNNNNNESKLDACDDMDLEPCNTARAIVETIPNNKAENIKALLTYFDLTKDDSEEVPVIENQRKDGISTSFDLSSIEVFPNDFE